MRYIDTGSRVATEALGAWLEATILRDNSVVALRWQSGFFGGSALGYFLPLMARLQDSDGPLHLLVGSNDGVTSRADIEALLAATGRPRENRLIGILSFDNAFYHPKVIHVVREDGSQAAYVGSANITPSGVALHIEAGMLLETRDGDDIRVLADIAARVDWWFERARIGLSIIATSSDLDALATAGIVNVPRPVLVRRPGGSAASREGRKVLARLVTIPALPAEMIPAPGPTVVAAPQEDPSTRPAIGSAPGPRPAAAMSWGKSLSVSDAQRKPYGNQRGSITLVTGDSSTGHYFREDLFGAVNWVAGASRTGAIVETATIPFSVQFLGKNLGTLNLYITYAPNRESGQGNYTSLLHLGPLAPHFLHRDVSRRRIEVTRSIKGDYGLTIS